MSGRIVYTTNTSPKTSLALDNGLDNGECYCDRCERTHSYCECDNYAYLGTHSQHTTNQPHRMVTE